MSEPQFRWDWMSIGFSRVFWRERVAKKHMIYDGDETESSFVTKGYKQRKSTKGIGKYTSPMLPYGECKRQEAVGQ